MPNNRWLDFDEKDKQIIKAICKSESGFFGSFLKPFYFEKKERIWVTNTSLNYLLLSFICASIKVSILIMYIYYQGIKDNQSYQQEFTNVSE